MKAALLVAAGLLSASCGAPALLKLPAGPGAPASASESAAALSEALTSCTRVDTLTADIAVTGRVQGRRLRAHLSAGVAAEASARLEATAPFGGPLFIFVARDDDATLLLPRDRRVLQRGRPADVLEALTGVPLGAAELRAVLTGCAQSKGTAPARRFGDDFLLVSYPSEDLYLQRPSANGSWRLAAEVRRSSSGDPRWRADYQEPQNGLPRAIRLTSVNDGGRNGVAYDLQLALSQVDVNSPLGPDVFTVQIPAGAEPISLDELRRSGPLATSDRSSDAR